MTHPTWRKSSFSGGTGTCVEVARASGLVLVRNSVRPDAGTLALAPAVMATWLAGVHAGDLNDLV
jgi:hypothetical protein